MRVTIASQFFTIDEETCKIMLQVADREEEGWLDKEDLENFPCEELRAIDKLLVKYGNRRFSFSVQKRIWLEEGGKMDYETECRLGDRVGWRVKGKWQYYGDLTFNLKAPAGHLPLWGWWLGSGPGRPTEPLLSRTDV